MNKEMDIKESFKNIISNQKYYEKTPSTITVYSTCLSRLF